MNESPVDLLSIIERLGGWGAFLLFLWIGWRQFMELAKTFSSGVLSKLDGIREVLQGHEKRLDSIDDALEDLKREHTAHHNQQVHR